MNEPLTRPDADDPEAVLAAVLALRRLADRLERDAITRGRQGWSTGIGWSRENLILRPAQDEWVGG